MFPNSVKSIGVVSSFFLLVAFFTQASQPTVHVDSVKMWELGNQRPLYCRGSAPYQYQVSSHAHAKIKWLLPAGSEVKKGSVIAEQDDFYLQRQLARVNSQIKLANARVEFSLGEFQRIDSMGSQQMASQSERQQLKLAHQTALMEKRQLEEEKITLDHQLAHLKHLAPADGVVRSLHAEPGAWVTQGQAMLAFLPTQQTEITCQLDVSVYQQLFSIENVKFSLNGQHSLTLERHANVVNATDQTIELFLSPSSSLLQPLRIGQRYTVVLSETAFDLSSLPYDALHIEEQQTFVWRVKNDVSNRKIVEKVPVTVVDSDNSDAVVRSQLQSGDQVVIKGKQGLKHSEQVTIARSGA